MSRETATAWFQVAAVTSISSGSARGPVCPVAGVPTPATISPVAASSAANARLPALNLFTVLGLAPIPVTLWRRARAW
ncbi:hypothetical protein Acsp05_28560 [Actinokineospora sp. NBRC 105648]|nr:hypothetical protein Acsp05_28560 [Actinokineospora sp. NBRC 105648]